MLHRCWNDEYVVFNNLSGDCHLLDADGFAVLACLQHSPLALDSAALARQLSELDVADPAELDALEQVLAGLAGCELIEALA